MEENNELVFMGAFFFNILCSILFPFAPHSYMTDTLPLSLKSAFHCPMWLEQWERITEHHRKHFLENLWKAVVLC